MPVCNKGNFDLPDFPQQVGGSVIDWLGAPLWGRHRGWSGSMSFGLTGLTLNSVESLSGFFFFGCFEFHSNWTWNLSISQHDTSSHHSSFNCWKCQAYLLNIYDITSSPASETCGWHFSSSSASILNTFWVTFLVQQTLETSWNVVTRKNRWKNTSHS